MAGVAQLAGVAPLASKVTAVKEYSMTNPITFRVACVAAALSATSIAHADSFTSSASSAGSASSGSVSASLRGSSNSSTGGDKAAAADYRIIEIAMAPDRAGVARITMQADDPEQRIVLDLPRAIVDKQAFSPGDVVRTRKQVYGFEFARGDTHEAFYLVLADDWYGELAARPVRL
jgi:hypothetical protein